MPKIYPIGFKIVTQDMRSLGLRKNPNILQFRIGEWYKLPKKDVEEGKGDWGGIWLCHALGSAKGLRRYMIKQYNQETRIFTANYDKILFKNSYRLKTNAVRLLEEVFS